MARKTKTLKLFRVYDGNSFIGMYRAYTELEAFAKAQRDQTMTGSYFKKSQSGLVFRNLRAVEVTEE